MSKTLVLYVFHIINDNVNKFIEKCIFYDENVDFIMISNNKTNKLEVPSYVKTLFRDNIGYDFGGWSEGILLNDLYQNYDKFIFLNASALGPFISPDYQGRWIDLYLDGLKNNVKLFGSTINTCQDPLHRSHVQSYIFALDKEALEHLIKCGIFTIDKYANTQHECIWQQEVLMSRKIIENGWNIGCLFSYYKDVDFTFSTKSPPDYNMPFLDDIMYNRYHNTLWTEEELVFIKGNRIGPGKWSP